MLKRLIAPVVAVAGLVSVNAHAAPFAPGYLGDMTDKSVAIGNSFSTPGSFQDVYIFDTTGGGVTNGAAVTFDLDVAFWPGVEFQLSSMRLDLFDPSNALLAWDTLTGAGDTLAIQSAISPGSGYKFVVSGNVTGTLAGSYGGLLQMISPVPEAETWMLLLGGLGVLVGARLRRRVPSSPDLAGAALA